MFHSADDDAYRMQMTLDAVIGFVRNAGESISSKK